MPGMDGFEVTQRIRQNTKLSFIPILLITAYDQPSVVQGLDMVQMILSANPLKSMNCWRGCEHLRLKHMRDERDQIVANEKILFRLTHDLRTSNSGRSDADASARSFGRTHQPCKK